MKDQKTDENPAAPEISIIVPVYHVEKTLAKALDSLLNQTFTDFELILVNDGGSPEETRICEDYARKDDRIVYVCQQNQGLSGARNRGLELHRGKWIMFLDSDDWVRADFCAKALESVRSTGADIGIFDLMYINEDGTEGDIHRSGLEEGVYTGIKALEERLHSRIQVYVWNKIYREKLWDQIVFPVGEIWEDDAVLHEVMDKAKSVVVIHEVLYYKLGRKDNITSAAMKNQSSAYWLYVQRRRRYEYLAQHHPDLLPAAAENMIYTLLEYGRGCVLKTGDLDGMEKARYWAAKTKIPVRFASWHQRIRYFAFLHNRQLFSFLEQIYIFLKKRGFGQSERH